MFPAETRALAALYLNTRDEKNAAETFRHFPMLMLEDDSGERAVSIEELHNLEGFWTVESSSMSSLIQLLKDTTAKVTCKQVAEFAKFKGAPLPSGMITNSYFSTIPRVLLEGEFQICELSASIADRRIDAKWSSIKRGGPRWINSQEVEQNAAVELRDELRTYRRTRESRGYRERGSTNVQIATADFPRVGLDEYFAVSAMSQIRILPGTPLATFLSSLVNQANPFPFLVFLDALGVGFTTVSRSDTKYVRSEIEYSLKEITARLEDRVDLDTAGFLKAVAETESRLIVFNPWSWERNESGQGDF